MVNEAWKAPRVEGLERVGARSGLNFYLVAFAWSSQNLMSISQSVVSLSRDVPAPPLAGDTPVELAEAEGATVRSRYIQQRDRAVVVLDHPLMP